VAAAAAETIVKTEIQVDLHRAVVVAVAQVAHPELAMVAVVVRVSLLLDIKKAPKGAFYLAL
jgi:hypothetical protein